MTQAEFFRKYNEKYREEFEPDLFKRDNQEMVDSIYQVLLSLEQDKYFTLKLLSFEPIWGYREIKEALRQHEESKRKKKDKKSINQFEFINIRDTDMILCKVRWFVRHNGTEKQEIDGKTIEVVNPEQILDVLIALPRFVMGYYFRLSGNYYSTTFQIVDGSTYNNCNASQSKADTVTQKTLFGPIKVFRIMKDMIDYVTGNPIKVIEYSSIIFNTSCNAMFYLLANLGLYGCMDFLQIAGITLSDKPTAYNTSDQVFTFAKECNNKESTIYISADKECFKDAMCQSLVASIFDGITKDATFNDIFDQRYWLKVLGIAFKNASAEKGLFVLDSTDGLYDRITKRDLHLSDEDKENIFCICRWLLREFSALRSKENVDIRTKRVRIAECIAAVYATKLNTGMHRITDAGRKITLKKVIQAVYTTPLYIINTISTMSNLFAYRDLINDNDATTALKYTYKGISGLGEDGGSVQPIYRYVDPTHVGILDLDASSNSDPGMSGMICPYTKIYNHSFSDYKEPDTWREQYQQIHEEFLKRKNEGKHNPFVITKPELANKIDYEKRRRIIEEEELELHRLTYPFVCADNPNIPWFPEGYFIDNTKKEEKKKGLFTVTDEDTDEEYVLKSEDDYDDYDVYSGFQDE